MTKFKLFLIALAVLVFLPLYIWVIEPTYQRYQIAGQAEAYFNEIPKYPGATPVEKDLSFYSIGYGYRYRTNDDPEKIISFYRSEIKDWVFDKRLDTSNTKSAVFDRSDSNLKLTIFVWKSGSTRLDSPPYDLTISVYKP